MRQRRFTFVRFSDPYGHQGNDLGVAGRHDRRRQRAIIVLGLPVGALADETIRAAELLRAEILRPVPGDQDFAAQPTERPAASADRPAASPCVRNRAGEAQARPQPIADIVVGRNSADPEQGLAVGATWPFSSAR